MTIERYTVGTGTLTIGSAPLDVSAQVTDMSVDVSESTSSTDALPVLSGEEIPAEEEATYSYSLTGNIIQDLSTGGLVDFSWVNAGDEVPFKFVPNTVEDRAVSGTVRVVPLKIGGTVKDKTPRSDLSWTIIGTPTFGDATP